MLIHQIKRYFVILILLSGAVYSQNPQFLQNKIFYTDSYFIDLETLNKIKTFDDNVTYYSQNDSLIYYGVKTDLYSMNKLTLQENPAFDTALHRNLISLGQRHKWNTVYLNGKKFELNAKSNVINIYGRDGSYLQDVIDNESAFKRNINGSDFIFIADNCVVHVKDLESETGYIISAYNEFGIERYKVHTEHTAIEKTGETNYHKRYLNYFTHNSKFVVFTSNVFYPEYSKTVIIELSTGALTEIPFTINGVLFDSLGYLAGLLQYDEKTNEVIYYDPVGQHMKWRYKYSDKMVSPTRITAISSGNKIILALYHRISTGSDMLALDTGTGKLKWHAKVEQLNVSHSKYFNNVNLYSYKDKVLLEGLESYGKYLQVFDINTGTKLYSDISNR